MTRFAILWNKPKDVDTFERYYPEVHIPLVKKMAGLRRYTFSPAWVVGLRRAERRVKWRRCW
jgi:uncharacterized protein (TIGR02118 family)